jgi:hypothetical protein
MMRPSTKSIEKCRQEVAIPPHEPCDVQVSLPGRAKESSDVRSSGDNDPAPASPEAAAD